MANVKKIFVDYSETGATVYGIVRRETDSYRLNDADGTFALAPADPYLALSEDSVIKGKYEVSESRQTWNDGKYISSIYKQIGGSPAPVNDTIIASWDGWIYSDILYDTPILNSSAGDVGITQAGADKAWGTTARVLTAGTNIVLAKGVGVTGFNDILAAQVNAEVVDALNVDTYTEPGQGAPGATTTLVQKISYIYKFLKNKTTTTSTQINIYNDAESTIDQKSTISDDGTIFSRGKFGSGP